MTKKKKKKYITLGILACLTAALFAVYAVLLQKNEAAEEEEETTAESAESLFDYESTDVLKVDYTAEGVSMSFARETSENDWYYEEDEELPVTQSSITSIVTTTCALVVNKEIQTSLSNLDKYGLDEPEYTVTLTRSDGESDTLYIGAASGSSTSYRYAYVEGASRVVTISNSLISKLETDINSLLDVSSYPEVDEDSLTRILYEDSSQTMELFNNPDDLSVAEAIGTTTWYYMDDGIYMPVNQSNSSTITSTVTGITFESCVNYSADDEELEEYGLADPKAKLTLDYTVSESVTTETDTTNDEGSYYATSTVTSDETFTLLIGNECVSDSANDGDDRYYYAKMSEGSEVFRISADSVELFTENDLSDYIISLYPTLCNFDGIVSISAQYDGKSMEIEVSQSTEEDEDGNETTVYSCKLNGDDYDETDTRGIFSSLIKVTADHIIADEDIKDGTEVVFSCTYTTSYDEKPEITFEISKYDDVYYQLSLNGDAKYAITKQEYNTLIENVGEFFE